MKYTTLLTRFDRKSRFQPYSNPNPVRRIENDWLGPDVLIGQAGTSRWRMESIAQKYGFNYGWGTKSELDGYLAAAKPVAVMLDIANDKAGSPQTYNSWGFHWVVVYAYDKNNYYVTNWPGKGAIPKAKFYKGWEDNVVGKAMGINSRFLAIWPK